MTRSLLRIVEWFSSIAKEKPCVSFELSRVTKSIQHSERGRLAD